MLRLLRRETFGLYGACGVTVFYCMVTGGFVAASCACLFFISSNCLALAVPVAFMPCVRDAAI